MSDALVEQVYSRPDIYKINVPLPRNPLKNLNSYVIKTPEKNLIIDTGFNLPESKDALFTGLAELEIDMAKTEIYATHLHADHTGLIGDLALEDTVIYMTMTDYMLVGNFAYNWDEAERKMLAEGFPLAELEANRDYNPARKYTVNEPFNICAVDEGDKIQVGPYVLRVISVPGHTPGNTCLYMENEKILFSGDHILFDISPNITTWMGMEDALGQYLGSLKKIREMDIRLAFPAHRRNDINVYERIEQLLAHHDKRLERTLESVKNYPGATSYDIAGKLQWSMRGRKWEEAPVFQKWFAVGETSAHLDHLIVSGKVKRELREGIYSYFPIV